MKTSERALIRCLELVNSRVLKITRSGRVFRLGEFVGKHRRLKKVPKRTAESPTWKGYMCVVVADPARPRKTCKVYSHILIWTYLNGPIPAGLQINHKNMIKDDNRPDNLELVTGAGNIQHSYANGRPHPYSKCPKRQDAHVLEYAKHLRGRGIGLKHIARVLDSSIAEVHRITSQKPVESRSPNRHIRTYARHLRTLGKSHIQIARTTGFSLSYIEKVCKGRLA